MTSAPLVLSWLVLAHLLADFVLQTETIALGKFGDGGRAWRALGAHVAVVGLVNLPLVAIFGLPGLGFVVVTVVSHLVIDRTKIVLTMRAEPPHVDVAPAQPASRAAPAATSGGVDAATAPVSADSAVGDAVAAGPPLDRTWTPIPAALFALDQIAHLAVLAIAWALLLANVVPLTWWTDFVDGLLRSTDHAQFHVAVLGLLVIVNLAIVNVRAAALFVATLVRAPRPTGAIPVAGAASPARIGATIGVLERLIVCSLVLAGAYAAIGLVIAAKTLARFKQLDDRQFAEYYLLGTLASVAVAILSSVLALAALPP